MTDNAPKPRPDKTLRWMTVILVAVVVVVGGYLAYRWILRHSLEKRYDAIRAAGYPVTLKELDEWYPTPPVGLNAADIYWQAFLQYSHSAGANENLPVVSVGNLPELGEPISPEMLAAVREYLAANQEALNLLHEAATYEECRYPVNVTAGPGIRLDHLAHCRQAARLLHLEAILKSEDGDAAGATKAVRDSLAVGGSLRKEPLLISRLVQISCDSTSRSSFERLLGRVQLTDEQLSELCDAFRKAENPEGMARGLVGERCNDIAMFENQAMLANMYGEPSAFVRTLQFTGMLDMDAAKALDSLNARVAAAQAPLSERIQLGARIDESGESLPRWRLFSRMVLSALSRAMTEDVKEAAWLRCAATAAAVERYRLDHGEFPKRLDALVPKYVEKIPTDPFSGAPLLYELTDEGCVVYSVGENEKDDGGVEHPAVPDGRPYFDRLDLPFRLLKKLPSSLPE